MNGFKTECGCLNSLVSYVEYIAVYILTILCMCIYFTFGRLHNYSDNVYNPVLDNYIIVIIPVSIF